MKAPLILALLFASQVIATPDCYDYSVTRKRTDYMEFLPLVMFYNKVDWMELDPGQNCAFYTYGDVFFKSYNTSVVGIHFKFYKGTNL
jgi:hypothetical protein